MSKIPTYIYKLVPSSDTPSNFEPLPKCLPLSALDTHSGFIHLSTAAQLPATLGRFFPNESKVYILRLEYSHVEKDIRWEDPKGENPGEIGGDMVFPHLYNGGQLGSGEVENVFTLLKGEGNWEVQEIQKAEWLIY